jgi:hypothetical protein
MAKRLRCWVGKHRWSKRVDDGRVFGECRDCQTRDWDRYQERNNAPKDLKMTGTPRRQAASRLPTEVRRPKALPVRAESAASP